LVTNLRQKGMRCLHENARTVPRVRFATASPTMIKIDEDLDSLPDNLIGFAAFEIDHKAHAAGVMLKLGIVKPLLARSASPGQCHLFVCCWIIHSLSPPLSPFGDNKFNLNFSILS